MEIEGSEAFLTFLFPIGLFSAPLVNLTESYTSSHCSNMVCTLALTWSEWCAWSASCGKSGTNLIDERAPDDADSVLFTMTHHWHYCRTLKSLPVVDTPVNWLACPCVQTHSFFKRNIRFGGHRY